MLHRFLYREHGPQPRLRRVLGVAVGNAVLFTLLAWAPSAMLTLLSTHV